MVDIAHGYVELARGNERSGCKLGNSELEWKRNPRSVGSLISRLEQLVKTRGAPAHKIGMAVVI